MLRNPAFKSTAAVLLLPFIALLQGCLTEDNGFERYVDLQYIAVHSLDDIMPIDGKEVVPVVYTGRIDLSNLQPDERKKKFVQLMLPSVLIVNRYLEGMRERLERIERKSRRQIWLRSSDKEILERLMERFRASGIDELKDKLSTHPVSIVLGQAALESGWGSSRFFIEGNNPFGIWAFGDSHSRLKAEKSRSGRPVYLKKYKTLPAATLDYYRTIARGPYREFREHRGLTDDPLVLTALLYNYSESRGEYVERLDAVIRHAGLDQFDRCRIAPEYLK